jgi:hypothetical protein
MVPPALLFLALGLALTFTRRSAWAPSLLTLVPARSFSFWEVPRGGWRSFCWIA